MATEGGRYQAAETAGTRTRTGTAHRAPTGKAEKKTGYLLMSSFASRRFTGLKKWFGGVGRRDGLSHFFCRGGKVAGVDEIRARRRVATSGSRPLRHLGIQLRRRAWRCPTVQASGVKRRVEGRGFPEGGQSRLSRRRLCGP